MVKESHFQENSTLASFW